MSRLSVIFEKPAGELALPIPDCADRRVLPAATVPARLDDRLGYVDMLRGIAILGVIMVHSRYAFADMPGFMRELGALGRYGVDLFFVVSAFTLFRSNLHFSTRVFLVRRWLRIAPVYYLGILVYTVLPNTMSPEHVIDWKAVAANLVFVNAWIPGDSSAIVPGGWSISCEVAFYCLLPLAISFVTTLRRSIAVFLVVLVGSQFIVKIACTSMVGWSSEDVSNFNSYGALQHLATFSLGIVMFHLLPFLNLTVQREKHHSVALSLLASGLVLLVFLNLGGSPFGLPRSISAGIPVFLFAVGMGLLNPTSKSRMRSCLERIGVVSYGIYLLHFGILEVVLEVVVAILPVATAGLIMFTTTFLITAVFSTVCAGLLHRYLEIPILSLAPKSSRSVSVR